jgi:SPP1 gp7 family putative phage head morphogenesis protein
MNRLELLFQISKRQSNPAESEFADPPDLGVSLGLAIKAKPDTAISMLKKRGENIIPTDKFDSITNDAHQKAFTVAKVMKADALQRIYDLLESGLKEGKAFADIKNSLSGELPEGRIRTIVQTNYQTAYQKGRYNQQRLAAETGGLIYWQWLHMNEGRTHERPEHHALHLKVFRYDDPFWTTNYPPYSAQGVLYNCNCRVRVINEKQAKAAGFKIETGEEAGYIPQPDDYNAFADWTPDLSGYMEDLKTELSKDLKAEPIEEIPVKELPKDTTETTDEIPTDLPIGMTDNEFLNIKRMLTDDKLLTVAFLASYMKISKDEAKEKLDYVKSKLGIE